ncbi:MAG: hypothetical protein LBH95_08485 [Oscillospiraceae bacterium]|jgi:hypothetical protein|nr:hypothetical protein [Oscillospiraceae bacterium]
MKSVRRWLRRYGDHLFIAFFTALCVFTVCALWADSENARFAVMFIRHSLGFKEVSEEITLAEKLFYTLPVLCVGVTMPLAFIFGDTAPRDSKSRRPD